MGVLTGEGQFVPRFEDQWKMVERQVKQYCLKRTGGHAHDAEDLLQETAARALRGYPSFRGDSTFVTWVTRIAARAADDQVGVRRRRVDEVPLDADKHAGAIAGADRQALAGAAGHWLRDALSVARTNGGISEREALLLAGRLDHPDLDWAALGTLNGLSGEACAQAHGRAITKLRMTLLVNAPDMFGGPTAIAAACTRAAASRSNPLTPGEEAVFRAVVLGRRDYRRKGWLNALRSACHKVVRELDRDFS